MELLLRVLSELLWITMVLAFRLAFYHYCWIVRNKFSFTGNDGNQADSGQGKGNAKNKAKKRHGYCLTVVSVCILIASNYLKD